MTQNSIQNKSKLIENFQIFFLLKEKLVKDLKIAANPDSDVAEAGKRLLYIDLCSFNDELAVFIDFLYKEKYSMLNSAGFLILTHRARKYMQLNDTGPTHFRNSREAHNHRQKHDILANYEKYPILISELQMLAQVALLIIRTGVRFFYDSSKSYGRLAMSYSRYKQEMQTIYKKKKMVPDNYIELLEEDMYFLEDCLKSHIDNYEVVAHKIECRLPWDNRH
jgi:hypothetical protein